MSMYTQPSRALATELRPGDHALSNQDLRQIYGISRVTAKARAEVAQELRRAGLEVLSDPRAEPLVVRKVAPARVPKPSRATPPRRPWWRRPWAIVVGAIVLLLVIVGALGSESPDSSSDQAALGTPVAEATSEPTPEATPAAQTVKDAVAFIADDNYSEALTIASALDNDDERSVKRRIARRIAFRATKALRNGNRKSASSLLREASDYPRTAEVKRAAAALDAAQQRARERAAAKRRATAIARAQRAARAEARRLERSEARRRAEAAEAAESASSAAPEPDTSGPSTTNWCGKRDGDGDGIYCEGM